MRTLLSCSVVCLVTGVLVVACDRRGSDPAPGAASAAGSVAVASAAPAAPLAPAPARLQHPAESLLSTWSSALDRHDEALLATLYAPHVRFYGVRKTSAEVLGAKQQAFKKEPDFRQRISDVQIEKTAKGFAVRFEKRSGADLTASAQGRLVLEAFDSPKLLITEESDSVTDKRFAKKPPPSSCYAAVSAVVTSLPAIEADIRRVARTNPNVTPGGILYNEDARNVAAAQGYFHPERFEPRWWVDVQGGALTVRDALSGEALAVSDSLRTNVNLACSEAEADAGAKRR
jgi:hypothetical protein